MSNSGNPSGALGDSGQQPGVSENSESRTVPPPVNDPNVLAFQTTQDPALAGGTRSTAEHESVIYEPRLHNPLPSSPSVNVSDSSCASSLALTTLAASASSSRPSEPVSATSNAFHSRFQQVQSSTMWGGRLRTRRCLSRRGAALQTLNNGHRSSQAAPHHRRPARVPSATSAFCRLPCRLASPSPRCRCRVWLPDWWECHRRSV